MVKKFGLVSAVLALLASGVSAESKSGLFVGVNVGVPITTINYVEYYEELEEIYPTLGVGYALGINVGYKRMLNDKMGLRYYVDYHFNQSFGSKTTQEGRDKFKGSTTITQHLATANVDFLYNFTSSFGAYVGIGLGYRRYAATMTFSGEGELFKPDLKTASGFALPINIGVNYNLSDNQTIDIGAKINTFGVTTKYSAYNTDFDVADLRTFIIKVGYTYTF